MFRRPQRGTAGQRIVALSTDVPIALVPDSFRPAPWLGVLAFVGAIWWLYRWMLRPTTAEAA